MFSSRRSPSVQRGGAGRTSPARATGSPSTTRVQEAAGAAVVRRWTKRPVGETAGVISWAPESSVCSVVTGPEPSAATDTTVSARRVPVSVTAARTNSTRSPSGDQVGSKSSQRAPCPGPSWPGRPVSRVSAPVRTSTTQMRYGAPLTVSPPRSEANAIRVPSGDQAGPRSSHGPSVSCRSPVPSGRSVQRWKPPPR